MLQLLELKIVILASSALVSSIMAPEAAKPKASPKDRGTKKQKAGEPKAQTPQPKKDAQNLLNQLKGAKTRVDSGSESEADATKAHILEKWQSLAKFDEEKKTILELWNKDKSCSWWKQYEETKGSIYKETKQGLSGFGSRLDSEIHFSTHLLRSWNNEAFFFMAGLT